MRIIYFCIVFCILILSACQTDIQKTVSSKEAHLRCLYDSTGYIVISEDDSSLWIVDTGASNSVFFKEYLKESYSWKGFSLINKKQISDIIEVDSFCIGELHLKSHRFTLIEKKQTLFAANKRIKGIIGMDILSQKYCYFDNRQNILLMTDSLKSSKSPYFTINYTDQLSPLFTTTINGKEIDNILFDTGCNNLLQLNTSHINSIPYKNGSEEVEPYAILDNSSISVRKIYYDSIQIGAIPLSGDLNIRYTDELVQLLGNSFVKIWGAFSIDPKKKEISFYK